VRRWASKTSTLKSGYFTTIGWCSVKTVADMRLIITSNTDKLFGGVNIDTPN